MKLVKIFLLIAMSAILAASAAGQRIKAEEVLAKHIESMGSSADRAAIKNQIAVGDVAVKFMPSSPSTQGRVLLVSEGTKNLYGMSLSANNYSSEKFSFDDKKVRVVFAVVNQRTPLGRLAESFPVLIRDGLLGGSLLTSWAMFNLEANKAKISFEGTKKIDGRETYQIGYSPKGPGDLDIMLFFDKETFRHVRSEYKRVFSAQIGRTVDDSARQRESRLQITENFSDFKVFKGITFPSLYKLKYSVNGQNGTTEIEWEMKITEFAFNQKLDANFFNAEAN